MSGPVSGPETGSESVTLSGLEIRDGFRTPWQTGDAG